MAKERICATISTYLTQTEPSNLTGSKYLIIPAIYCRVQLREAGDKHPNFCNMTMGSYTREDNHCGY